MANRNYPSKFLYSGHVMPVEIDCQFTVAAADAGGLGQTGLTGAYVQNVFMHTSQTPGAGNKNPSTPNTAITNPNPAAGTIIVQLTDQFKSLYAVDFGLFSPNGTPAAITAASTNQTVGVAYTITTLGDATLANWRTLGVPKGITPAVGVSFVALATGAGTGTTARVAPTAAAGSNIFSIEVVGNPNLSLAPNIQAQGFGGQIILQCRNDSSADAPAIATPADGTVIGLKFILSNSSVTVGGS